MIRFILIVLVALLALPIAAVEAAQADLTWTNPSGAAVRVERRDALTGTAWVVQTTTAAGATAFSQAGLAEGNDYCYRLIAVSTFGDAVEPWPEACGNTRRPANASGFMLIFRP